MILVREISSYGEQAWNDFVMDSQGGTIFHRTQWLTAMTAARDVKLLRLGFFEEDRLIGILPLVRKGSLLFSVAASPFVVADTPYLGIIIPAERMQEALLALDKYLRGTWTGFLRLMQRQKIECKIPGITVIEKTTHIVDLHKSENELWLEMEGRCRTAIRKAQKSGVTVSLETDPEIIDIYYKLLTGLYANQKMCVPHDKNFYREIFESFSGNSLFILASRIESQIIGGIILVRDRERFYYLDGASNPDFNHLNPNNLLLWEGILLAKRLGGLKFDFVGSDIPRLAAFKKSFGGDLHYHSCLEKAYVPGFALLRKLYPAIKAFRGRFSKRDDA